MRPRWGWGAALGSQGHPASRSSSPPCCSRQDQCLFPASRAQHARWGRVSFPRFQSTACQMGLASSSLAPHPFQPFSVLEGKQWDRTFRITGLLLGGNQVGSPPEEATRSPWEPVVEKGRNTFPHTNPCWRISVAHECVEGGIWRLWGGRGLPSQVTVRS